MPSTRCLMILAAVLAASGCSKSPEPLVPGMELLAVPATGPATAPHLSGVNGELILSWLEPGHDGTALRFSRLFEERWSPPSTVVEGVEMFVNWADLPSVVPLGKRRLAAHWLVKQPGGVYSYDVAFAYSDNLGIDWSEALTPHDDGTPAEHGFVTMFPLEDRVGLIWLDGRNSVDGGGMTLRGAFVGESLALHGEQEIDDLTCDCCPTDVALATSGPVAVYRGRTEDEIRDIKVARFVDGEWQAGPILGPDNWNVAACPVNGPRIVAGGTFVAVAWFTAADTPTVRLAISNDSGESFDKPIDVQVGETAGRVGLVLLYKGDVAVSWMRLREDGNADIQVRRASKDGTLGPVVTIVDSAAAISTQQMVGRNDELFFAWTEGDKGEHRVMSARLPVSAL